MKTLKELQLELKTAQSVKTITTAYQELARMQMMEIRDFVLKNRVFIEELAKVYFRIKKNSKESFEVISKIPKTILVLFSANQMFYGPLLISLWSKFVELLNTSKSEILIVGKVGKEWFQNETKKTNFYYFEIDDEKPQYQQLQPIFDKIKNYKKIIVVHGKFINYFLQGAMITDLTSGISPQKEQAISEETYLFEPSYKDILEFFETEILKALFYQIVWEHQLAKFASRMIAMYQASENAQEAVKKLSHQLLKEKKVIFNKKQVGLINIFNSLYSWIKKRVR